MSPQEPNPKPAPDFPRSGDTFRRLPGVEAAKGADCWGWADARRHFVMFGYWPGERR